MPPSMQVQAQKYVERRQKYAAEKERRQRVVTELRDGQLTPAGISKLTGVSRTTVRRIKEAVENHSKETLQKLLNPAEHHPGRRAVINDSESSVIVQKLDHIVKNKRSNVTVDSIRSIMGQIARQNTNPNDKFGFNRGVPSSDAIRSWRARYHQIALCIDERIEQEEQREKEEKKNCDDHGQKNRDNETCASSADQDTIKTHKDEVVALK